ncbi:GGDEF domain-containing protein [Acidithiobacillus ferrivorans]|uniref:GGDEF domain-containing protein n=1 Tax=Acidithiobacillus ferrivorans TaxID=160808 RepID=UPI001E62AB87|nr:GGDEF domain-containing protein [Acidithiobacillus ferrivorans]
MHEPVPGYPWTIAAGWPSSLAEQAWWDEEKRLLPNNIGIVLGLLGIGAFTLFLLAREMRLRNRQEEILIDERDHQKKRAIHDALTGLPNRDGLRLVFVQALARSDRQEQLLAVGFLDLDDFKPVNDTYGHAAGDDLLQEMARRLQNAVRRADTVARLGGDEFILLLEGLRSMDELDLVLARLQTTITQPFYIQGEVVSIRASLGLTLYPFDEGMPTYSCATRTRPCMPPKYDLVARAGAGCSSTTRILAASAWAMRCCAGISCAPWPAER